MYREIMRNRKDAERYRRLRDTLYKHGEVTVGEAEVKMKVVGHCPSPAEFDAAIDQLKSNEK
jgi:hypothetical protein